MNKKIFVETSEGFSMIPVDNLYFKTDNQRGIISASQNLNHSYAVDIIKIPVGIYNNDGKKKVMRRLFTAFINAIELCTEVLTIEQSINGVVYMKDGQQILRTFDPENQTFSNKSSSKSYPRYSAQLIKL